MTHERKLSPPSAEVVQGGWDLMMDVSAADAARIVAGRSLLHLIDVHGQDMPMPEGLPEGCTRQDFFERIREIVASLIENPPTVVAGGTDTPMKKHILSQGHDLDYVAYENADTGSVYFAMESMDGRAAQSCSIEDLPDEIRDAAIGLGLLPTPPVGDPQYAGIEDEIDLGSGSVDAGIEDDEGLKDGDDPKPCTEQATGPEEEPSPDTQDHSPEGPNA